MSGATNLEWVLDGCQYTHMYDSDEVGLARLELATLKADAELGRLVRQAVEAGLGDIIVDHTLHCDDNRLFDGCTCGAWTHQAVIDAVLERYQGKESK